MLPATRTPRLPHVIPLAAAGKGLTAARRFELVALLAILAVAFAVRVVGAGRIEPNLLPNEADHLSVIYRILEGWGPGLFDLSGDGNPAFALYPSLLFVALLDPDYLALRLSVSIASVLTLAAFYAVCRRHCAALPALAATGLLAFSHWALFFSRNGGGEMFVALYAMLAAWSLQRALVGDARWPWMAAGFWTAMGWYGFLAGMLILPALLAPLPIVLLARRLPPRRLLTGAALMLSVWALVVLPRVPSMVTRWDEVQQYIVGRSILQNSAPEQLPRALLDQTRMALRAYLLLDPTLEGNRRYHPPGTAPLDSFSGTLYVGGLVVALLNFQAFALWISLLVVPIAATQVPTTGIPDLSHAIAALPAHFLFVGLALDRLLRVVPARPVAEAALIVAVPAVGWTSWHGYVEWMRAPATALAREPAVDYGDFDAWRAEQQRRAAAGRPALPVTAWRELHPRPSRIGPGSRGGAGSQLGSGGRPPLGTQELTPLFAIEVGRGARAPRGVAVQADGTVIVADQVGRVARLDPRGPSLTPLPGPAGTVALQSWDLATDAGGFLYLADPERNAVHKLDPGGRLVATLGADWGMYRPRGVDVGPDGRIYVADTGRNRVVVASTEGVLVGSIGPRTSGAELEQPTDVALDDAGRLYIALPDAGRLEVLDLTGVRVGSWPIATGETIESPRLAVTERGAIVLSEPGQGRVRLFDPTGRQLGAIQAGLTIPFGLAASGSQLYITDIGTGRLLAYELAEP